MSSNWMEKRLSDVAENISRPFDFSRIDRVIFVNTGDVLEGRFLHKDYSDKKGLPGQAKKRILKDDILFSEIRPGNKRYAFVDFDADDYVVSTKFMVIRAKEDILPRYLYLILTSDVTLNEFQIVAESRSGTFPQITFESIGYYPILVPPLKEQSAILETIGAIDHKNELNLRMNETLEAIARAIFKSWFVDSTENDIPKGWRRGKVEELLSLSREAINPSEFSNETFDYYSIPVYDEGRLPKAETGEQIQSNKFIVTPNAVLLSKLNPRIPRIWLPNVSQNRRSVCSTEFLVAIPQAGIPREFLYGLFSSKSFLEVFATLVTGTSGSHQRVKPESLVSMDIAIPSKELIARFTETVGPMYKRVVHNLEQSRTLAATRDALLPKLLSGEIRVRDAEKLEAMVPSQPETSKVVPSKLTVRKAPKEFVEAILIAALVRDLSTQNHPLGRKRYQKFSYLVHRRMADDVTRSYLKKAAGPYNPEARYGGPEEIALKNGYVRRDKSGKYEGFVAGPKIGEVGRYLSRYQLRDSVRWAIKQFRYATNDDLELFTTVDYAVLELKAQQKPITVKSIRTLIASDPEWLPKLSRDLFSEVNVQRALNELRTWFPETYEKV